VGPRAVRGGSWINNGHNARSAQRNHNQASNRRNNLGFRFALSSMAPVQGHGGAWTRRSVLLPVAKRPRVANRQAPGVRVGGRVDARRQKLPGLPPCGPA
jgi:hypothetical protein